MQCLDAGKAYIVYSPYMPLHGHIATIKGKLLRYVCMQKNVSILNSSGYL